MAEASNSAQKAVPSLPITKEEFLARATALQDQLRNQNPDWSNLDLKLSSGWWKPAIDLGGILHVSHC